MTLAATLDLDTAAATCWDVLVIGAGPAGSLVARELARPGNRVLLVDKDAFPRWKVCGCCLNARALGVLQDVGLADLPQRCGAVPLRRAYVGSRSCGANVPLPAGVALSREVFDAALIEAATTSGVAFLPRTRAALAKSHAGHRLVGLHQTERQVRVPARLVLVASGLGGNVLAEEPGFDLEEMRCSRFGAGAVVAMAPAFYETGTIFMACGAGGYVGLVRLEDGRLDVGAAFDAALVRGAGGLGHAAARILAEVGWPAIPDLVWRGTPRLTRHRKRLAAGRLFVVGDAAGYVEPFTGEGMAWALAGAAALAPLAAHAVADWQDAFIQMWADRYHRTVTRRQSVCRITAATLRHPHLARAVIRVLASFPGLARPFVRHLNQARHP
jgi:flavin-dependent dehydrogenase